MPIRSSQRPPTEALTGLPADRRACSWLSFDAAFSRELGRRGWIGLALPREYGGGGRSPLERFVVVEELLARGTPVSAHWIVERQSAPMILRYGSEAQKRLHVPRICRGESFFAIGMSEPQADSDLANVRTRATRVADGWRLNGQKIWTTNGPECEHMIALVRTSGQPDDRQRGLSQLLLDPRTPGITVQPIEDLAGDRHFSEVFFDDVLLLPADALLRAEGTGWQQVTAELGWERSGPERIYSSIVLLDTWLASARQRLPGRCRGCTGRAVGDAAAGYRRQFNDQSRAGQGPGNRVRAATAPSDCRPARRRRHAATTRTGPQLGLRDAVCAHLLLAPHARTWIGSAMNEFAESLDRLLAEQCRPACVLDIECGADQVPLWWALEGSGFLDALVPAERGGAGLGLAEAFDLFVLHGYHALPVPMEREIAVRAIGAYWAAPCWPPTSPSRSTSCESAFCPPESDPS